jgi:hypothetical protein
MLNLAGGYALFGGGAMGVGNITKATGATRGILSGFGKGAAKAATAEVITGVAAKGYSNL